MVQKIANKITRESRRYWKGYTSRRRYDQRFNELLGFVEYRERVAYLRGREDEREEYAKKLAGLQISYGLSLLVAVITIIVMIIKCYMQ